MAARKASKRKQAEGSALAAPSSAPSTAQPPELETLVLIGSAFALRPGAHEALTREKIDAHLTFHVEVTRLSFDQNAREYSCIFTWRLFAEPRKAKADPFVRVEANYLVRYGGVDEDPVRAARFAETVGEFATYPYFRSLVSQYAWASSLALPIMPTITSSQRVVRKTSETSAPSAASAPRKDSR